MESTAWCVVWFGFPNEDWIHPQSLTVHRVEYAALQPVSMEILRSCSVSPPPLFCCTFYQTVLLQRGIWARVCMCVCGIQRCVNRHTNTYRAIDGYAYAIVVVLSSMAVNVHVCVLQLSVSSSVTAQCVSVCLCVVLSLLVCHASSRC